MPSTTIHISRELLSEVDQVVQSEGISRNRFIVEACKQALQDRAGEWPFDFFESDLNEEELRQLQEAGEMMEADILAMRHNRKRVAV